jgi:putative ABC transport system substrate-binding protein
MSRLAVLWNPTSVFLHSYWDVLKTLASALHVTLQSLEVRDPKEFEAAFEAMTRERADGVIVLSDTFTTFHRTRLAELAAKYKLPAMYGHDQYTEAGGLMSYGPLFSDGYRHAANFVDKILKGAKPADLPVELNQI